MDTAGVRTTLASAVFKERVPSADAEVVRRLTVAGAVLLGKQNLHEVAFGTTAAISYFGPVHNPWKHNRIAGGSSGGSAAAVAAGLCFGAVGTDAGGSIRVPSALFRNRRPQADLWIGRHARRRRSGLVVDEPPGPMCRSVADVALMLSAIAGYDPRDSTSVEVPISDYTAALRAKVSALRLGAPRSVFYESLDPEIEAAINTALGVLRRLTGGLRESRSRRSPTRSRRTSCSPKITRSTHRISETPELYHAAISRNLQQGSEVSTADYIPSRRELDAARRGDRQHIFKRGPLGHSDDRDAAAYHRRGGASRDSSGDDP